MFLFKTSDETIQRIGDCYIDLDQRGVHADASGPLFQNYRRRVFGRLGVGSYGDFVVIRGATSRRGEEQPNKRDERCKKAETSNP